MRVSSKAHYGLRMMTEFAKAYGAGPLSIAEVARVEHLPLAYLEQLAAQLRIRAPIEPTLISPGALRTQVRIPYIRWIMIVQIRVARHAKSPAGAGP